MRNKKRVTIFQSLSGGLNECEVRSRRAAFAKPRPSTALLPLVVAPLRNWQLEAQR